MKATALLQFLCCAPTNTATLPYVRNCVMAATVPICVIITGCVLDRSISSSKANYPESAISCFLIQFRVSSYLLEDHPVATPRQGRDTFGGVSLCRAQK